MKNDKTIFLVVFLAIIGLYFVNTFKNTDPEKIVYISQADKKYHTIECSLLKENQKKLGITDALKDGYTPCLECKP